MEEIVESRSPPEDEMNYFRDGVIFLRSLIEEHPRRHVLGVQRGLRARLLGAFDLVVKTEDCHLLNNEFCDVVADIEKILDTYV